MTTATPNTTTKKKAQKAIVAAMAATILSGTAMAQQPAGYSTPVGHDITFAEDSRDFRRAHPLRVFVDVDTPNERRERRERRTTPFEARTLDVMHRTLPDYIQIVSNRRHADMVVRAQQTEYSLNFRVVDVDREDRKYKKKYRNTHGRCGLHLRAYYTEVKEKGEAFAAYNVRINIRGERGFSDYLRVRSAEDYRYAKDLTARTNCGTRPTNHYPSRGVADLFANASPAYRDHIAREIRQEAAEDLGKRLARQIRGQANSYYTSLAVRMNDERHNENGPYYSGGSWEDARDDDYGWRIEYGHHAPRQIPQEDVDDDAGEKLGAAVLVVAGLAILAASSGN